MAAVQMGRGHMGDEKLGTVGAGARVRHGKHAGAVMPEVRGKLVFKTVAGASHARAGGIAALDHEIRNHAVEGDALVVPSAGEVQEVGYGDGRLGGVKGQFNVPFGSGDDDIDVLEAGCGFRGGAEARQGAQGTQQKGEIFFHGFLFSPLCCPNKSRVASKSRALTGEWRGARQCGKVFL